MALTVPRPAPPNLLEPGDVAARLPAWGLIDEVGVAAGDLTVSSAARRHLHIKVERRGRPWLLIKQPDPGVPDSRGTLRTEGRFYVFCREEPRAAPVVRLLPRWHRFFPAEPILVLEMLAGSRPLWRPDRPPGASNFPVEPSRALGRALGTLHTSFRLPGLAADPRLGELDEEPPGILSLHRPDPRLLRHLGPADLRLLRLIQSDAGIAEGLDTARAAWRVETLVHGDVRSHNVLVVGAEPDATEIRLIDWEMAQRGDPAWDLAGALADFALLWLAGMPSRPDLGAAARVAAAEVPLTALQSAIRAFWRSYVAAAGPGRRQASRLLRRAVAYAAALLVRAAWEAPGHPERPSSLEVLLLQLAANVFADPQRATRDLFGLAIDSETA